MGLPKSLLLNARYILANPVWQIDDIITMLTVKELIKNVFKHVKESVLHTEQ